jgi:hypothetical protein
VTVRCHYCDADISDPAAYRLCWYVAKRPQRILRWACRDCADARGALAALAR